MYSQDMDLAKLSSTQTKELLEAQAHIWKHNYGFQNVSALKCAIQLGIPDAIQQHGRPITLTELANALAIHPTKAPFLYRLMRLLIHSNFFIENELDNGEVTFDLTINSQLLVKKHPLSLAPFVLNTLVDPSLHLSSWLKNDDGQSPFHIVYGRSIWEYASCSSKLNDNFNKAMGSDSRLVSTMLLNSDEAKGIFQGIDSIVDVGGGTGTMAKAISVAYPQIKCIVLDLPRVVEGLQANEPNLVFVGGDMFQTIPPANVALLKSILHDWGDEDCIKILGKCKEAVRSKEGGGKVIIIDMVVEDDTDNRKYFGAQVLFDMQMMALNCGGKERTEREWTKLFLNAGFHNGYKILPILGLRSVIEIYP